MIKTYSQFPFFLLLLIILFNNSCQTQSSSYHEESVINQKAMEIDKLVRTYADYGDFNGAILVSQNGEIVYKNGFGYAEMEWNIPNHSFTKFRIGSISKQFTAMLIMQLVADQKLDLHTPISAYLQNYPKENGDQITIHHLLTHTSGIPNHYESTKRKAFRPDSYTSKELVEEFSALPLEFTPGSQFSYCNAGYNLLGHLIEEVYEKRYEEVLQEKIFDPLKMKHTGFDKHRAIIKNRASGYFESFKTYYNSNYVDMSNVFAAGALYSTVEDLFKWDQALYTDAILPNSFRDSIFIPYISDSDTNGFYGYGWSISDKPVGNSSETVPTIWHDGVIDGFCAIITRIPSSKSSIILLSNVRRAPLHSITKGVMGILHDQSYDFPRRSVAFSMLEIINSEGLEKGIKHFHQTKSASNYYLVEEEINIASYKLLENDQGREAAEILRLGIAEFPEAFNLYDSYGEVLRALGDIEASITNYKKSVELNPENENGKRMLLELGKINL